MPLLSQQLSLDAFEEDFCFAYIFSNFVWRGYGTSWLYQAAQGLLGQLAFDSAKALAETSFGKSQKSYQTEMRGRMKYGKALRCLIEDLSVTQGSTLRGLVIPVLLLLMHSATLTDPSAALFHLQGMTRILSICGPHSFQHQPLRDAFEAARATITVASLVTCKRVFLDDPAWRSVPYDLVPAAKTPQSYLMDILASIPGLLEDHKKLEQTIDHYTSSCSTNDSRIYATDGAASPMMASHANRPSIVKVLLLRSDIITRIIGKLQSIFRWRWYWQQAFGSDVTLTSHTSNIRMHSASHTLGFQPQSGHFEQLSFSRTGSAADIALYNAVLMWLVAILDDLEPVRAPELIEDCACQAMESVLGDSDNNLGFKSRSAIKLTGSTSFEPLRRPGPRATVRDLAIEICRVFEWQSRNHHSTSETNLVYMLPIGLAMCVLEMEPENRHWIRTMLDADVFTRNYGAHNIGESISAHMGDTIDHELDNNIIIGSNPVAAPEGRILRQLQGFAFYLTRELTGANADRSDMGDEVTIHPDESHPTQEVSNPGLVHLLLLRRPVAVYC